jgi:hypothetical protein
LKIRNSLKLDASPTVEADFNTLLPVLKDADIEAFGDRIASTYMSFIAKFIDEMTKADPTGFPATFNPRFSSGRIILVPAPETEDAITQQNHHIFTLTGEGSLLVEIVNNMFSNEFQDCFKNQILAQLESNSVPYLVDLSIRSSAKVN